MSSKTITAEGKMRLRRVQAMIRSRPGQLDMSRWAYVPGEEGYTVDSNGLIMLSETDRVPDVPLLALLEQDCGTTCCIGGLIVADAGEQVRPGERISLAAERLIGFDDDENEADLFFAGNWPHDLRVAYYHAMNGREWPDSPEQYDEAVAEVARVMCEAIDRWIDGEGSFV